MSNFNTLPHELLRTIFQTTFQSSIHTAPAHSTLVSFQPITAVCRRWRSLSIDIFYGTLICEQHINWKSNISLAIATKHTARAHTLRIGLYRGTESNAFRGDFEKIQMTLKQQNFDSVRWPISTIIYCEGKELDGVSRGDSDALWEYLGNTLHVKQFECANLVDGSGNDMSLGNIFMEFPQIHSLHVHAEDGVFADLGSAHIALTYLSLDYESDDAALGVAGACARTLEFLRFTVRSLDYNWFHYRGISFDRLTTLIVKFAIAPEPAHAVSISSTAFGIGARQCVFPKLRVVETQCTPCSATDAVALFVRPGELRTLRLDCPASDCEDFVRLDSRILVRLTDISLVGGMYCSDETAKCLVNRLAKCATNLERAQLELWNRGPVDLAGLRWPKLRKLSLMAVVRLDTLPRFLSTLDALSSLVVAVGEGSDGGEVWNGVVSRTLAHVTVYDAGGVSWDCMWPRLAEFLLALPRLWVVSLPAAARDTVRAYMLEHAHERPFAPDIKAVKFTG